MIDLKHRHDRRRNTFIPKASPADFMQPPLPKLTIMSISTTRKDQIQSLWLHRLACALRTALACTIVGCTVLYSPLFIRRIFTYPAFSYMTLIMIMQEATLGDTLRCFWHVFFAIIQVMVPSMLSLSLIGPARFTKELAALAVALGAFVVALPASTSLMTKRIAFGQIVIVYVGTFVHGAHRTFMHPIHVAACSLLGALASVLALLFPYPLLASNQFRKACREYAENTSERLTLIVEVIFAQNSTVALELLSQEKTLSLSGIKFLQRIKDNMGSMIWEKRHIKFMKPNCMELGDKLEDIEATIKGMELALSFCPSFSTHEIDEDFKQLLQNSKAQIDLKLEPVKCSIPFDATKAPEGLEVSSYNKHQICLIKNTFTNPSNLSSLFILCCMQILLNGLPISKNPKNYPIAKTEKSNQKLCYIQRTWRNLNIKPNRQSLFFAFKCSISLSLAVLLGMMYNKENAYWSGLTIGISFATRRQATFSVANARVQGTTIGSIYGLLSMFVLKNTLELRLLPLLPWIIFTSFLMHSKMYSETGGISAVIGALLILGRTNYKSPSEFAIARITEASIGLICFIFVEVLLSPKRASTLAKHELSKTLGTLRECFKNINLSTQQKEVEHFKGLKKMREELQHHVNQLESFISEAESEPNFWFLPFNGSCYRKLHDSLSTLTSLLLFVDYQMEFLSQVSHRFGGTTIEELLEQVNGNLEAFYKIVGSSLGYIEEATSTMSLQEFKNQIIDIELTKAPIENETKLLGTEDLNRENILSSFFEHLDKVTDKLYAYEGEEEQLKCQMVLHLTAMGFCIQSLLRGTMEMEKEVKELVKWERG